MLRINCNLLISKHILTHWFARNYLLLLLYLPSITSLLTILYLYSLITALTLKPGCLLRPSIWIYLIAKMRMEVAKYWHLSQATARNLRSPPGAGHLVMSHTAEIAVLDCSWFPWDGVQLLELIKHLQNTVILWAPAHIWTIEGQLS